MTCNATNSGEVCIGEDITLGVIGSGGTGSYTYLWTSNGPATFNDATLQNPIAYNAIDGEIFKVVITDANKCTTECTTIAQVIPCISNCETVFARDVTNSTCFIPEFSRWGWYNQYTTESAVSYNLDLYRGAAQCEYETKGDHVGTASVLYNNGAVTITYNLFNGYVMSEAHVYVGCNKYPTNQKGSVTVAPGQYNFNSGSIDYLSTYTVGPIDVSQLDTSGGLYVIAHAVVCDSANYDGGSGTYTGGGSITNCNPSSKTISSKVSEFNAFPVPFDEVLTVQYKYDYDTDVQIQVFDTKGLLITNETDTEYRKGEIGTKNLDLSRVADQALIIRLVTNKEVSSKMVISKSIEK